MKDQIDTCFHCEEKVNQHDGVKIGFYLVHNECYESQKEEDRKYIEAERNRELRDRKNTRRIKSHLKRKLKPKIWDWIEYELESHYHSDLKILRREDFESKNKVPYKDMVGNRTSVRHIYDDTSQCSMSETYGGNIYIYIGNKQYLKIFIWG